MFQITISTQAYIKDGLLFISILNSLNHNDSTSQGNKTATEQTYQSHFKEEGTDKKGTGTGLNNIRQRLYLCYGDKANIHINSQKGQYVVMLQLPLRVAP